MPPGTVLAGPACRGPTATLPRSPLSLPHPAADTGPSTRPGPTCQPRPHRVGCAPPLSPVARQRRCPRPMAGGHYWPPRAADHRARGPLSSFSLCHAAAPAGTPSFFPSLPRATEALQKPPAAARSLFSLFSSRPRQTRAPPSPPPTRPPSPPPTCLVPVRAPPPPVLHGETLPSATVVPIEAALTFPLPHRHCSDVPPSPPATGALSPLMNASVTRLLHRLHNAPPFG
jgi:hypothetical protein